MIKKYAYIVTLILFPILIMFFVGLSQLPKYKVGDCLEISYDINNYKYIVMTRNSSRYTLLGKTGNLIIVRTSIIDKVSKKVDCSSKK